MSCKRSASAFSLLLLVAALSSNEASARQPRRLQAQFSTTSGAHEPDSTGASSLLIDLERIVTSREGGDWFLDQEALESLHSALLESVCRASEAARQGALAEIQRRAAAVGEPRWVFTQEGQRVTGRFEEALSLDRQQRALKLAVTRSGTDCPFWIPATFGFESRQTDRGRWTLGIETGGNVQIRRTQGRWTLGGGGLGRLLPGYGISNHVSLLFGAEFGGGAMLRPGSAETEFVINYFPAIPVVLRLRGVNFRYDVEAGAVGLFQADNTRPSYGARVGTSLGLLALRTRNLLPWAGVAVTYEYYFENSARPAAHFVRGGLRVGVQWDP